MGSGEEGWKELTQVQGQIPPFPWQSNHRLRRRLRKPGCSFRPEEEWGVGKQAAPCSGGSVIGSQRTTANDDKTTYTWLQHTVSGSLSLSRAQEHPEPSKKRAHRWNEFSCLRVSMLFPPHLTYRFSSLFSSYLCSSLEGGQSRGKERVGPACVSLQCVKSLGSGSAVSNKSATEVRSLSFFLPLPSRSICSGFQLSKMFILHLHMYHRD